MVNGNQKRKLPRRTIGVPTGQRGATISQAGAGLLRGSANRQRRARGNVLPQGRKVISSGIRKSVPRSTSVNIVRRTEFAQRTGKIPENIGTGEFKFPNLTGSRKQKGLSGFDFGGGQV